MRALTVALALAALAVTACGDDERDIGNALHDLRQAWLREDYGGVCDRLTAAAQREIGQIGHGDPTTCERDAAQRLPARILSPRDRVEPDLEAVEVDGDTATAVAVLGGTTRGELRFARQDGVWKLDRIFGTTAPPPEDLR